MFTRIYALIAKEFLVLLKDRRSRTVLFLPPIFQLLVFGYAATFDLHHIPCAVYDEDGSVASRRLLARFEGSSNFQLVRRIQRDAEIAPLIDSQECLLVLHIGPQFERDMMRGRTAPVQVLVDGRNSNTALVAAGYVRTIIDRFNADWSRHREGGALPARVEMRAWFNPNLESRWFIVPGIVGLLTLVVTILVTGLSVAREREQGTFDQLLVAPYRPAEILIGKAVPGLLIGLTDATLIILIAVFWFQIPLVGSLWALYTGLLLFLISAVGVGLMISSLSTSQQQGLLGAFFFLVPAVILSGFATPIANMPQVVQWLTVANPLRYFMVILRSVFLEGTPLAVLIDQLWPMAVIGAINLSLAAWLFRRRAY